jgi:hypothetical protein
MAVTVFSRNGGEWTIGGVSAPVCVHCRLLSSVVGNRRLVLSVEPCTRSDDSGRLLRVRPVPCVIDGHTTPVVFSLVVYAGAGTRDVHLLAQAVDHRGTVALGAVLLCLQSGLLVAGAVVDIPGVMRFCVDRVEVLSPVCIETVERTMAGLSLLREPGAVDEVVLVSCVSAFTGGAEDEWKVLSTDDVADAADGDVCVGESSTCVSYHRDGGVPRIDRGLRSGLHAAACSAALVRCCQRVTVYMKERKAANGLSLPALEHACRVLLSVVAPFLAEFTIGGDDAVVFPPDRLAFAPRRLPVSLAIRVVEARVAAHSLADRSDVPLQWTYVRCGPESCVVVVSTDGAVAAVDLSCADVLPFLASHQTVHGSFFKVPVCVVKGDWLQALILQSARLSL